MIPYTEYAPKPPVLPAPVTVLAINGKAYAVIDLPADYPVALLRNWIARIPKSAHVRAEAEEAA